MLAFRGPDGDDAATAQIQTITRVIAEQTGAEPGDLVARTVANALLGLHRALIDHVRAVALAGASAGRIRRELRAEARRAIAQLEHGLGDVGVRASSGPDPPSRVVRSAALG